MTYPNEFLFLIWVERTDRILSDYQAECVYWTKDEDEAKRFVKFASRALIDGKEKAYYTKTEKL